jgi:hypothetical protein
MDLVMSHSLVREGNHEVHSLSARQLWPALQIFFPEQLPDFKGSLSHECVRDTRARIQIKDHNVGMFYIVNGGVPRVQFHGTELNQSEQPRQVFDPEPDSGASFTLLNA